MKMMRFNRRSNLDEFQEQKLLKIESKAFWIALWGLLIVYFVQYIIGFSEPDFFKRTRGELFILVVLVVYTEVACMKQGIWSRRLKPNAKTNLIISIIAAFFTGVMVSIAFYMQFNHLQISIIVGIITAIMTFILCIAVLLISSSIYKKKLAKLEDIKENELS